MKNRRFFPFKASLNRSSWNASKELLKSHSTILTMPFFPNTKTNILREKKVKKAIHENHLTYQHTKISEENKNLVISLFLVVKIQRSCFHLQAPLWGKSYLCDYYFWGWDWELKHSPTNQPPSLHRCASGMSGLEVRIKGEDQWVTNPKQISTTLISRL